MPCHIVKEMMRITGIDLAKEFSSSLQGKTDALFLMVQKKPGTNKKRRQKAK